MRSKNIEKWRSVSKVATIESAPNEKQAIGSANPTSRVSRFFCSSPLTAHPSHIYMVANHASDTPAPELTATVAPFRAWRSSQSFVAGAPTWFTIETSVKLICCLADERVTGKSKAPTIVFKRQPAFAGRKYSDLIPIWLVSY